MNRRFSLQPVEGWLTVALIMVLSVTVALSLDAAHLVPGAEDLTAYLPITAVLGVTFGLLGPKVGWGRWTTYLIGGTFAALIVPILVGNALTPTSLADAGLPGDLFGRTAAAAVNAYTDLIVRNRTTTSEIGHHLWVLGLLVWASSMFASYAAFGHRRPINAVILLGLLLIGNMSLTRNDQLIYLVVFSLASLFLLIRFHTFDEQADWLRRRIGDPAAISGMYLRGGTVFIGVAVIGSLLLTRVAASDPLAGAWTDVSVRFVEWSRVIERFLPDPAQGVAFAPTFGDSATIGNAWVTNDAPAFTIEAPTTETEKDLPYLRAATYDVLLPDQYIVGSPVVKTDLEAKVDLLAGTSDAVTKDGRREVTYRITPKSGGSLVVAPETPESIDIPTTLSTLGDDGFFSKLDRRGGGGAYDVTSLLRGTDETDPATVTAFRLGAAGKTFPAGILERYAAKPGPDIVGPKTLELLDKILAITGPDPSEYLLASTIQSYMRDPSHFNYSPDVAGSGVVCGALSRVECFATYATGFCRWYAATMAALMRQEGFPVRIAEGFRRPARTPELPPGTYEVKNSDAHAWVEVYFPRYGWVDFDPTGGGRSDLPALPTGKPEASPSGSSGAFLPPPLPSRGEPDDGNPGPGGRGNTSRVSAGPFIAIALLLALLVATIAFLAWRRGPRGPVSADSAYWNVARLAGRFGFGPRPSQTPYEYAGALAEVVPRARPQLETVAQAKVEVVYGGRQLDQDRLAALRDAQRQLRVQLLSLLVRRARRLRR